MAYHNGAYFSTMDNDNDQEHFRMNCAQMFGGGGWWYKDCFTANLHGSFTGSSAARDNVNWYFWRSSFDTLQTTEMRIRNGWLLLINLVGWSIMRGQWRHRKHIILALFSKPLFLAKFQKWIPELRLQTYFVAATAICLCCYRELCWKLINNRQNFQANPFKLDEKLLYLFTILLDRENPPVSAV